MNGSDRSWSVIPLAAAAVIACGDRRQAIDYRTADPVADARLAMIDSGHFHLLAVKVGDSVIAPSDTSVLKERSYNVEVAPEGGMVFLAIDPDPHRPGWPSVEQLRYLTRYNTELFALLDTNYMSVGLPPNKRLKLTGALK